MYHFSTFKDLIEDRTTDVIELERSEDVVWLAESRDDRGIYHRCVLFDAQDIWPTLKDIRAQLTDGGYRMLYQMIADGHTIEAWCRRTSSEVSSQDKQ